MNTRNQGLSPTMDIVLTAPGTETILRGRTGSMMRPDYLPPSAWTQHLPFAFWLIETLRPRVFVELGTHHGASYFGFCQAVQRFDTNTACYAVDTWAGDEHAGFYGEEGFRKVSSHNNKHYCAFSTLIRSTFDEAVPYIEDGTVDLLHIDGLHTYEAVRNDFETWLPKLSSRAVVILHDTNVRERNFGVFAFFKELRQSYPCFEFIHGHGLGVVGVGTEIPAQMQELFVADQDPDKTQQIRHYFSYLGEHCQDRATLNSLEAEVIRLEAVIASERERIKVIELDRAGKISAAKETADKLTLKISDLEGKLAKMKDGHDDKAHLAGAAVTAEKQSPQAEITEATRILREALEHAGRHPVGGTAALPQAAKAVVALLTELRETQAKEHERTAALDKECSRLNAELAELTRRLLSGQDMSVTRETELEATLREMRAREQTGQSKLKDTQAALEKITKRFEKLEVQVRAERVVNKDNLSAIHSNIKAVGGALAPVAAPSRLGKMLGSSAMKAQLARLRRSGLVDEAWYAERYPDVAGGGMDACTHYLLFGAAEGRLPRDMTKLSK